MNSDQLVPLARLAKTRRHAARLIFSQKHIAYTRMEWEFSSWCFSHFDLWTNNRSKQRSSTWGWTWSHWGAHKCTFSINSWLDAQFQPSEDWAVDTAQARWLAGWVSSNGGRLWPGLTPVWPCSDLWPLRSWLSTCSAAWVPERSALGPRTSQSEWRRAAACCLWLEKRWEGEYKQPGMCSRKSINFDTMRVDTRQSGLSDPTVCVCVCVSLECFPCHTNLVTFTHPRLPLFLLSRSECTQKSEWTVCLLQPPLTQCEPLSQS